MLISVRGATVDDALAALKVHHAAIRVTAAPDYSTQIIERWAPLPINVDAIAGFNANPDNEMRFVAEIAGAVVGFAAIVPDKEELRACYVAPQAQGRGVGKALIAAVERAARMHRLTLLRLDSSLTAHRFYEAMGYETLSFGEHSLGSGHRMACVHMAKDLA